MVVRVEKTGMLRSQLDNVQRHACLEITCAMRTAATKELKVILNILPLHLFIKFLAIKVVNEPSENKQ